jgi:hypothetical protein
MSEERAHRINEWMDGWINDLSSKRQDHNVSKERGLRQIGSSRQRQAAVGGNRGKFGLDRLLFNTLSAFEVVSTGWKSTCSCPLRVSSRYRSKDPLKAWGI